METEIQCRVPEPDPLSGHNGHMGTAFGQFPFFELMVRCLGCRAPVSTVGRSTCRILGTELTQKPGPKVDSQSSSAYSKVGSVSPCCSPIGRPRPRRVCWLGGSRGSGEQSKRKWRVFDPCDHIAAGERQCHSWANGDIHRSRDGHGAVQLPVAKERDGDHWRDFLVLYDPACHSYRQW